MQQSQPMTTINEEGKKTCSVVPPGIYALTVMPWLASLQDITSHFVQGILCSWRIQFWSYSFCGLSFSAHYYILCVPSLCFVASTRSHALASIDPYMLLKPWFRLDMVVLIWLLLLLVLAMVSVVNSIASCTCTAATIAASHTSLSSQITGPDQFTAIATSAAASGISHSGYSCILCVCVTNEILHDNTDETRGKVMDGENWTNSPAAPWPPGHYNGEQSLNSQPPTP